MIIKVKKFSQIRGIRNPKSFILNGIRSVDGKRLDQDINRNLGQEISKLQREKRELSQSLGGGNSMNTYKIRRFSTSNVSKTYRLKRKTFGIGDAVSDVAGTVGDVAKTTLNTGVDIAKKTAGTGLEAGGGAIKAAGKIAKPVSGLAGRIGGAMAGAALGPLGALGGFLLGGKVGKAAADGVQDIGESIQQSGTDLKMS